MTQQHPITPPPELVRQWLSEEYERGLTADHVAIQAAQWGADQELEACIAWFDRHIPGYEPVADRLRAARRPPSLKEQALAILDDAHRNDLGDDEMATIRRALEQLDD
jgi:hypothetical protein